HRMAFPRKNRMRRAMALGRPSFDVRRSFHDGDFRCRRMRSVLCCAVLASCGALLSGCAAMRDYPAPNLPTGVRLVDTPQVGSLERTSEDVIMPASGIAASKLDNVLVLSGGGMNGAFPAGLLKGWSEAGTRPQFDVVTGISTGALIAPFAFLGT